MSKPEEKEIIARPTTGIEKIITVIIMIAGVAVSLLMLLIMVWNYEFSFKLLAVCLVTGPGALGWGLSNYRISKFWDSYYGKRITFRSTK